MISLREDKIFHKPGWKKKLAMNNHIQTVSRVDDYDQTFNSNDETSRTILHRWKNQWQGSSLRIPTGKITWEHNDNITAAAFHITVNSSRLHWQRQCHACKLTRKSSWGNSIKTVTHSIFCFSSLKNYLIPLLSFQSDVSLRAIKPKAALVEMQHRVCFHCTHSPCNAQQSFGNHCRLPKKKGKESKKYPLFPQKIHDSWEQQCPVHKWDDIHWPLMSWDDNLQVWGFVTIAVLDLRMAVGVLVLNALFKRNGKQEVFSTVATKFNQLHSLSAQHLLPTENVQTHEASESALWRQAVITEL